MVHSEVDIGHLGEALYGILSFVSPLLKCESKHPFTWGWIVMDPTMGNLDNRGKDSYKEFSLWQGRSEGRLPQVSGHLGSAQAKEHEEERPAGRPRHAADLGRGPQLGALDLGPRLALGDPQRQG